MAGTAIQNIKILHKRYSTAQWTNGIQVNGQTVIPTLAQGEIGFNTTTLEVRIGTNSAHEQNWSEAHLIDAETNLMSMYTHKDGNLSQSPNADEEYVATSVSLSTDSNKKHVLSVNYKSIDLIAPERKYTMGPGSTVAGEGEIDVFTGLTIGEFGPDGTAYIVPTFGAAATKEYVDNQFSTAKYITVQDGGTSPDDGSTSITYVSAIEESTADHTISVKKQVLELPSLEVNDETETSGKYISAIAVDDSDDHKLVITKANLPTLTAGTGSGNGNGATVVGGISVSGHEITAAKKTVEGVSGTLSGESVVNVQGTNDKITITVDTYNKAHIDALHNAVDEAIEELGKSMEFMGTLASNGTGTVRALPVATDNTIGHVYKVSFADTYNSKACKVGDMFICDPDKVWRYIPSGDDIEDTWRPVWVNGSSVADNRAINFLPAPTSGDETAGVAIEIGRSEIDLTETTNILIRHGDTSDVLDLTPASRQYVTGLDFDDYGHVVGYTVGTETDQELPEMPSASGGQEGGNLQVISKAVLGTDSNGDHTLSTAVKTLSASDKINVAESGSTITFKHDKITTSITADSTKDVTITAGGANNTITIVDPSTIVSDTYGHITELKTKQVTFDIERMADMDTTYDLGATSKSTVSGQTAVNINLTAGGSGSGVDTVSIKADANNSAPADGFTATVANNEITLGGKATKDLLGLIRAAYTMTSENSSIVSDGTLKTFTGNNNGKLYGVNVRTDGTAFVEVPWTDTTYTGSEMIIIEGTTIKHVGTAAVNKPVDMYAFGTDAYGHISSVAAITTIDGNYA